MEFELNSTDLETISKALRCAEYEIHNPGYGRNSDIDVLDLIDRARELTSRALKAELARKGTA